MKADDRVYPLDTKGIYEREKGLTVRDYIAIQAMNGLLLDPLNYECISQMSYELADAMIEQSEK